MDGAGTAGHSAPEAVHSGVECVLDDPEELAALGLALDRLHVLILDAEEHAELVQLSSRRVRDRARLDHLRAGERMRREVRGAGDTQGSDTAAGRPQQVLQARPYAPSTEGAPRPAHLLDALAVDANLDLQGSLRVEVDGVADVLQRLGLGGGLLEGTRHIRLTQHVLVSIGLGRGDHVLRLARRQTHDGPQLHGLGLLGVREARRAAGVHKGLEEVPQVAHPALQPEHRVGRHRDLRGTRRKACQTPIILTTAHAQGPWVHSAPRTSRRLGKSSGSAAKSRMRRLYSMT